MSDEVMTAFLELSASMNAVGAIALGRGSSTVTSVRGGSQLVVARNTSRGDTSA